MGVGYRPRVLVPQRFADAEASLIASFEQPLDKVRNVVEQQYAERVASCEERERMWFVTSSDADSAASAPMSGRERWTRLNEALNSFGLTRSKNQRWFHRQMSQAIIRKLFKDDFAENIDFLREQFQVDDFKPEVMIITPRRWGKTYSVAMFVAACAYAIEGTTQAIFSTGRRASKKLLDLIYQLLCKLPGMRESIIVKNVEEIRIQGPGGPSDIRTICSYPSKVTRAPAPAPALPSQHFLFALVVYFGFESQSRLCTRNEHAIKCTVAICECNDAMTSIDDVVALLMQTQQCVQCNEHFNEMDSLGAHTCRRHFGDLQTVRTVYGGRLNTYTCCGVSPCGSHPQYRGVDAARGCGECDHTSDSGVPQDICMAYERASILFGHRLDSRHVDYDARSNTLTIHRISRRRPSRVPVMPPPCPAPNRRQLPVGMMRPELIFASAAQ